MADLNFRSIWETLYQFYIIYVHVISFRRLQYQIMRALLPHKQTIQVPVVFLFIISI